MRVDRIQHAIIKDKTLKTIYLLKTQFCAFGILMNKTEDPSVKLPDKTTIIVDLG